MGRGRTQYIPLFLYLTPSTRSLNLNPYLNPKSRQNNNPKPLITAIKAIVLHTFRVQVNLIPYLAPSKFGKTQPNKRGGPCHESQVAASVFFSEGTKVWVWDLGSRVQGSGSMVQGFGVYWGLYWGTLILGNYQIFSSSKGSSA